MMDTLFSLSFADSNPRLVKSRLHLDHLFGTTETEPWHPPYSFRITFDPTPERPGDSWRRLLLEPYTTRRVSERLCQSPSLTRSVRNSIARNGQFQLPGFEFPSKDESNAKTDESGLLRLLMHIVSRVALKITENAGRRIARRLRCCASVWLTFRFSLDAILSGSYCHCNSPSLRVCLKSLGATYRKLSSVRLKQQTQHCSCNQPRSECDAD